MLEMNYQRWLEASGITSVGIGRWGSRDDVESASVLRVELAGKFGLGTDGHESGRVLRMLVAAALVWDDSDVRGLIIDVTRLEYSGSDSLMSWDYLIDPDGSEHENIKVAFLCGSQSENGVRSLLEECGDNRVRAFISEADATRYILDGND
jgi:hypothetical protein